MFIHGKAVASIEDSDSGSEFGGFTAVLSTPSMDRDGDKLHRDEWMDLPDKCPLDVDHGMTVADTIGSFRPYFDGEKMMMDATFSSIPKAQEVRTLIKEGHISTVSIAFMTDKSKKDGEPRRELLNAGVVAIPSNRDSVILNSKALDLRAEELAKEKIEAKAKDDKACVYIDVKPNIDLEAFGKAIAEGMKAAGGDNALVQAIHDAAVHLGAICTCTEDHVADMTAAPTKSADEEVVEHDMTDKKEAFEKALDLITETSDVESETPQESPADEAPAEAAAASDEEPAPADEAAADDAAESDVAIQNRLREIEIMLSLSES